MRATNRQMGGLVPENLSWCGPRCGGAADRAVWGLAIWHAGRFLVICHKFKESDADTSCGSGSGRCDAVIDMQASRLTLCGALVFDVAVAGGCSRRHYREQADRNVYDLLSEHTLSTPWEVPQGFSVYPDPRSRLADPSIPDCPRLPAPGPLLYSQPSSGTAASDDAEELPAPAGNDASSGLRRLPLVQQSVGHAASAVRLVVYAQERRANPADVRRRPHKLRSLVARR